MYWFAWFDDILKVQQDYRMTPHTEEVNPMWIIGLIIAIAFIALSLVVMSENLLPRRPARSILFKGLRDLRNVGRPYHAIDDIGCFMQLGDNKDPFDIIGKCFWISGCIKPTERNDNHLTRQ